MSARAKDMRPIGDVLAHLGIPDWRKGSDEYWQKHDAAIRDDAVRSAAVEREKIQQERETELLAADFPPIAVEAARALRETRALEASRRFLGDRHRRLLVLSGGTGAGKTTAAAWIAMQLSRSATFVRAAKLEALGRWDADQRVRIENAQLLVLDDLGAEHIDAKSAFRSMLDEIVDTYYSDRRRRMVITTNLRARRESPRDPAGLAERYGERMLSRLREHGMLGDCGVEDLRRKTPTTTEPRDR